MAFTEAIQGLIDFHFFLKVPIDFIARGHKFAEAAEVGFLLSQLLQLYNDKLQLQVEW